MPMPRSIFASHLLRLASGKTKVGPRSARNSSSPEVSIAGPRESLRRIHSKPMLPLSTPGLEDPPRWHASMNARTSDVLMGCSENMFANSLTKRCVVVASRSNSVDYREVKHEPDDNQ